jgi:hypothetical protein
VGVGRLFHDFVWAVQSDIHHRYYGVDSPLLRCELEFDGSRGDDFDDLERANPLMVQLPGRAVSRVVLGTEPTRSPTW